MQRLLPERTPTSSDSFGDRPESRFCRNLGFRAGELLVGRHAKWSLGRGSFWSPGVRLASFWHPTGVHHITTRDQPRISPQSSCITRHVFLITDMGVCRGGVALRLRVPDVLGPVACRRTSGIRDSGAEGEEVYNVGLQHPWDMVAYARVMEGASDPAAGDKMRLAGGVATLTFEESTGNTHSQWRSATRC